MKKKFHFIAVLTFYTIALELSIFFRVRQLNPDWYLNLSDLEYGWVPISLFKALGPLVGGLFCILFLRKYFKSTISLTGKSLALSLIYFLAPVLMIGVWGVNSDSGGNTHLFGLLTGLTMMGYCLFEETGWRGFLQDAFRGILNPYRFIIIGVLWYFWHLNFLTVGPYNWKFGLFVHLPSCIFGSWIIGYFADKYKSLLIAAAIHSMFNIFFDLQADLLTKAIIATGVLLIWILTSFLFNKNANTKSVINNNSDLLSYEY